MVYFVRGVWGSTTPAAPVPLAESVAVTELIRENIRNANYIVFNDNMYINTIGAPLGALRVHASIWGIVESASRDAIITGESDIPACVSTIHDMDVQHAGLTYIILHLQDNNATRLENKGFIASLCSIANSVRGLYMPMSVLCVTPGSYNTIQRQMSLSDVLRDMNTCIRMLDKNRHNTLIYADGYDNRKAFVMMSLGRIKKRQEYVDRMVSMLFAAGSTMIRISGYKQENHVRPIGFAQMHLTANEMCRPNPRHMPYLARLLTPEQILTWSVVDEPSDEVTYDDD